jgi:PelA/Pel-15E family pectate lyase
MPARARWAVIPLAAIAGITALEVAAAEPPRPWPPNQFAPVTLKRIAALPTEAQPAWRTYWETSQALAKLAPAPTAPDFSPLQPLTSPLKGGRHTRGLRLDAPPVWYASDEARMIADRVVAWQTAAGGWTKGINYLETRSAATAEVDLWSRGTFDNDATIFEMRILALVTTGATDPARAAPWREAFLRGLHYVFNAQYPNGGFPQVYPLAGGYHDAITFNDNAMTHALELLRDVAADKPGYGFVPAALREEAGRRLARGIDCMLAAQIKTADGRLTGWCQQYDALTLQPCAARNFEPIATCTSESVNLAGFLMSLPQPSPKVVAAVDGAMAWFRRTVLRDLAWSRNDAYEEQLRAVPGAPPLWARFYEIGTDKPIFGDRDRTIHYAVEEISAERRNGYAWYGDWPAGALQANQGWRR